MDKTMVERLITEAGSRIINNNRGLHLGQPSGQEKGDHGGTEMRKIIGAMAMAGVLFTGCAVESSPAPSGGGGDSGSIDRATANLAWSTLSAVDRSDVCETFWLMEDSDIIDYLMSPPDALSRGQSEAFVDLLWEKC